MYGTVEVPMTWIPRSRVGRWVEWNVVVPIRRVRNRIGCAFGRHFSWNPYFLASGGMLTGVPTGVAFCVSCGIHRCVFCSGEGVCGACEYIRESRPKVR